MKINHKSGCPSIAVDLSDMGPCECFEDLDMKNIEIKTASFRIVSTTPGHITYGVWINGGKSGDLVLRINEVREFEERMKDAGFQLKGLK